ncbi:hypothetical protein GQ457_05G032130 [Hibiscus cannabinus]
MVKGRQGERVRLYVRGTILGYKRSKSNQYPNTSLIQIEGVNTKEEVAWLLDLMVIVVSFVLSSSLIFPPNLWEIEYESSCIPAIYELSKCLSDRVRSMTQVIPSFHFVSVNLVKMVVDETIVLFTSLFVTKDIPVICSALKIWYHLWNWISKKLVYRSFT